MTGYHVAARTQVFWDVDDFPVPPGRTVDTFPENLKEALEIEGYDGDVSIWAYYGGKIPFKAVCHFRAAQIMFLLRAKKKCTRLNRMLIDMVYWAYENPPTSGEEVNLLLIAKDIPNGDTEFVSTIEALKRRNYNVSIAVSDDCPLEEMPLSPTDESHLVWRWSNLFDGLFPIENPSEADSDEDYVTSVEEMIPIPIDPSLKDSDCVEEMIPIPISSTEMGTGTRNGDGYWDEKRQSKNL